MAASVAMGLAKAFPQRHPSAMNSAARYDALAVRNSLLQRKKKPDKISRIVRYAYRSFDNRWLYWEAEPKLLVA